MSDERWSDIEADSAAAVNHFSRAIQIYQDLACTTIRSTATQGGWASCTLAGHTSIEKALLRVLQIQGEEAPSGRQWHADLIQRAGRSTQSRPAILPPALVHAIDRTRKFRHVAVRAYDSFDLDDAEPAVRAAEKVAAGLAAAIAAYRQAVDPPA